MCCYHHKQIVDVVMKKFGNKSEAVFWKIVRVNTDGQIRPMVGTGTYTIGEWNDLPFPYNDKKYRVNRPHGFHVYVNRDEARAILKEEKYYETFKLVRVICLKSDFMRAGTGSNTCHAVAVEDYDIHTVQAVFKSIYICPSGR